MPAARIRHPLRYARYAALPAFVLFLFFLPAPPANAALVAHYSFDAAATTDDSGNGLDLTAAGAPALVAGQFGSAADLDGVSYLWSNAADFDLGAGDFSLSFWYMADANGFESLLGRSNSNLNQGYVVNLVDATEISADFNDEGAGVVDFVRPGDDDSVFHHVVFLRRAGDLELYLDGVLQDLGAAGAFVSAANAFALGGRNISLAGAANSGGTSQFFDGRLDEVWVFDHGLSPAEITNLALGNSLAPAGAAGIPTLSTTMLAVLVLLMALTAARRIRRPGLGA